jgi:hypothetical protein
MISSIAFYVLFSRALSCAYTNSKWRRAAVFMHVSDGERDHGLATVVA